MNSSPLSHISPDKEIPPESLAERNKTTDFWNDGEGQPHDVISPNGMRPGTILAIFGSLSTAMFLGMVPLVALGNSFSSGEMWRVGIAFGFGFGLVSLSAIWTVFGPFRFFTRVPLALLLVAFAMMALTAFFLMNQKMGAYSEGVMLVSAAASLQWIGLVVLFVATRAVVGRKLALPGSPPPVGNRSAQFEIRQILIWTTGVAIFLAVLRLVIPRIMPGGLNWTAVSHASIEFGLLLGFNLVVACSIIWAILSRGNLVLRLAVAIVLVLLATWLEHPAFKAVLGPGGEEAIFWWINGAGTLCLGVNLLIVRLCGYRLVR